MIQVDYISARKAIIEAQKSSPYEIGLGWTVDLRKTNFVGRKELSAEKLSGSKWNLVGLEIDWTSLEKEFGRVDLVPQVLGRASRAAVPVFHGRRQIGQVTSHTFSPILKKYIGIASLESRYAQLGKSVEIEITVEYVRRRAKATIVRLPFFDPPGKKA
jgi:aminomethyltransferase